jgi:hypothetical protein
MGYSFVLLFFTIISIFNLPFWISAATIVLLAFIGLIITRRDFKVSLPKTGSLRNYLNVFVIFAILFTMLLLLSSQVAGYYGTTLDDGSDHTLFTRIILDNPNALITRSAQPYGLFNIAYPLGTHMLCSFLQVLLTVQTQKIVIMVSLFLPALIALSLYSTIKCLFEKRNLAILGLVISAFFAIGLSWVPVSWGGLPLLLSIFLSLNSLTLIVIFLLKRKFSIFNAFILGLIFFSTSQTYPDAFLIAFISFLFVLVYKGLVSLKNFRSIDFSKLFRIRSARLLFAFLIPIVVGLPFFYFTITNRFSFALNSEVIFPSSYEMAQSVRSYLPLNWIVNFPALLRFFSIFGVLLELAPFSIFILLPLLVNRFSRRLPLPFSSKGFKESLFLVFVLMISIIVYLTVTIYLPIPWLANLFDSERVWQHVFVPAAILTAVVIYSAAYLIHGGFKILYSNITDTRKRSRNRRFSYLLLGFLVFGIVLSMGAPVFSDQLKQFSIIETNLDRYNAIGKDDVLLMQWVLKNIPAEDLILVSMGDSGQFVSAVSQRLTITSWSYLANYSIPLMEWLTANASDLRIIPYLIEYNVSYVYIGSIGTSFSLELPYYRHFNASQFIETPYFNLTKEFGSAYLFQFNETLALKEYEVAGITC